MRTETTVRPPSSIVLGLSGLLLMGMGLYFLFLRPPLLPEDLRFIGPAAAQFQAQAPGLLVWLRRVFWVMGGYIFTTGLLLLVLMRARRALGRRAATGGLASAGLTSIGWMTIVNVMLHSAFRWSLLGVTLLWDVGVLLVWLKT